MTDTDMKESGRVREQYATSRNLDARVELHRRFSTNKYGWNRWVFDQFDLSRSPRVLELGCGTGLLWRDNSHRVPDGLRAVLSDFSPGMLASARQNAGFRPGAFDFQVIDAQDIPFGDGSFDIVIANHMLYHVPDRHKAFSEINRVLRAGGTFYATTIGLGHMKELTSLVGTFDRSIQYSVGGAALAFGLENGAEQLTAFFSSVERRLYDDSFEVTDAEILTDYVLSAQGFGNIADRMTPEKKNDFTRYLAHIIERDGRIHITKASGLFKAIK